MLEQGSTEINQDQPVQHAVVSSFFSAKYDRELQKLLCFLEFPEGIRNNAILCRQSQISLCIRQTWISTLLHTKHAISRGLQTLDRG
jgi:c-di-GMP-related signal transduction protein